MIVFCVSKIFVDIMFEGYLFRKLYIKCMTMKKYTLLIKKNYFGSSFFHT